ncbi:hypothetical protein N0V84_006752 [Fusarium piperis]|uniref:FAD-binding domain-containing protein n=1 Tax=Fusarium piperis TaxID=1435070 RepID=A0A9W8WBA8_9HYPO|nr:hypothetical protein N0V84_006752 [Fusarium piperis]
MKVIIVGAGPAGLLLATLLQKRGIQTQVLEASDTLDDQPRACHYGGPGKRELSRAGVLDKISAEGFHPGGVSWRRKDGSSIVALDSSHVPETSLHRMVCLPLGRVIRILHDEAVSNGCQVLMQHKVTPSIGQTAEGAWVDVVDASSKVQRFHADYVVGCDGANSQIRRALFGDLEFPGRTWDQQIIASNVYYPFEKLGYGDSNFIVDQSNWYMAAKITKDGMWRVTGGLGLVGGIADVGSLYDALVGIDQGLADESILDKYSDIRRQKYQEIVDPMSSSNFRRLWEKDPETTIAEDDFFKLLRKANEDEALLSQLRGNFIAQGL